VPGTVSQQHASMRGEIADQRATIHLTSSITGFAFADAGGGSIGPLDITIW
jgi:hypothetical protein